MNQNLAQETARLADVLCALNLLAWDARTHMPARASTARGHQVSTLTALARDIATGPRLRDALAAAEPADEEEATLLTNFTNRLSVLDRIPKTITVELAGLATTAHAAWIAAREADDFQLFEPSLARIFALQRELAQATGYDDHPYDALLDRFETGMTLAQLKPLFADLRSGIAPLLESLRDRPVARDPFAQTFPIEGQRRFAANIATKLGYDFTRGRVDDTIHPFEISLTRDDVRITTRFREDDARIGMFGLWHEAGHGIYEQNVARCWTRSLGAIDLLNLYAVGGSSFGLHESQSRLYENRIGRSRPFWELHYASLCDIFPDQLRDIGVDTFWRAVNTPRIGLIRTEADELTYDAHVMLRVELEAALISNELNVSDLPAIWNERMAADFGLRPPDLARGVLQDVHWSSGYVGSFATYTLGNVMSSQFFAAANHDPTVATGLAQGNYAPLTIWLNEKIHQHGRTRNRDRLLQDATGNGLDPAPYLADLRAKAEALA